MELRAFVLRPVMTFDLQFSLPVDGFRALCLPFSPTEKQQTLIFSLLSPLLVHFL